MQVRLLERIGIDAVDLECDVCGLRMQGPNGRAVATLTWIITTALEIGAVMKREEIEAARLETERDARLAGEPGARAANYTVLLGVALRHGAGYTPRILSPRDDLAAALVEAGQRARYRCGREGDSGEAITAEMLDLRDLAGRGYVHVGRMNARQVAWRQLGVRTDLLVPYANVTRMPDHSVRVGDSHFVEVVGIAEHNAAHAALLEAAPARGGATRLAARFRGGSAPTRA